uniref:Uncharacterized protein n=1 Tax=Candidatus Kentrum sp. LPFa TaxID=2126335 RepID=A0A450XV96_9GAMM|nr:MAG: protein of unknown function (DUF4258) [Candidatus Kentron sp. LPFa]VFK17891.1 MAG: protein of unknown function (DUF4258) [Candidatus Kentron sp. LPFa]VFK33195.1 MAG: protein of unknown function (DUF4258) [Candidatus Kentron sp. LPFa]
MSELVIEWDEEKNDILMRERRICFQDVLAAIEDGRILEDSRHPNHEKYHHQRVLVVEIGGYACAVPYVREGNKLFLKTIYRSRTHQKRYSKHGSSLPKKFR